MCLILTSFVTYLTLMYSRFRRIFHSAFHTQTPTNSRREKIVNATKNTLAKPDGHYSGVPRITV